MDITIEGFHSWMWRGLSFLLPFLFMGYMFQLYNAYVLYQLSSDPEATWQVCKHSVYVAVAVINSCLRVNIIMLFVK